jgi:hypothetical protein
MNSARDGILRQMRFLLSLLLIPLVSACQSRHDRLETPPAMDAERSRMIQIPESMAGSPIVDLDWVDTGTVAVVTDPGTSVSLIPWHGQGVQVIGRKGDGPGELRMATAIVIIGTSHIAALDGRLRKVTFWTPSGIWQKDTRLDAPFVHGMWNTDSGLVVGVQSGARSRTELLVIDTAEAEPRVIRRIEYGTDPTRASCPYCPIAVDADLGYVANVFNDTLYRLLRVSATGETLTPIERTRVELPLRTPEELDSIRSFRSRLVDQRRSPIEKQALRAAFDGTPISPRKYRFVAGPVVDEALNVWVSRSYTRGMPAEVDVFDAAGTFRATVRFPDGTRVFRVRAGVILTSRSTEAGEQYIQEFRVPSLM